MGMIPAKCTNCGANIQVDDSKEAGICEACGTAFITEKAINNYNIKTSSVNINGENINIFQTDIDEQIAAAKKLAKEDLVNDASKLFNELKERYPHEYKVWWEYSLFEYKYHKRWFESQYEAYKKARALSDEENLKVIDKYVQSEKNRIYAEGKNIIDFCKHPDYSMLDNIYVSSKSLMGQKFKLEYKDNNLGLYSYVYESNLLITKSWYNKILYAYLTDIKYDIYDNKIVGILTFAGDSIIGNTHYVGLKEINIYIQTINGGKITVEDEITDLKRINQLNETKSQGCYIATAVYGSYDCPPVWTLRRFRDNTLAETKLGRVFIRTYYVVSPILVKWFGNTSWFKKMWKCTLDKMVAKLQENGVEDTPYQDRNW